MSEPWTPGHVAQVRAAIGAGLDLWSVARVTGLQREHVDLVSWSMLGRPDAEAAEELNAAVLAVTPLVRERVLACLRIAPRRVPEIAAWLGLPENVVILCLRQFAREGRVDADEPPPPCGPREMRWFALERAAPCP